MSSKLCTNSKGNNQMSIELNPAKVKTINISYSLKYHKD